MPKVATLFVQENARRGVILSQGFFFNTAHDDDEACTAPRRRSAEASPSSPTDCAASGWTS